MPRFRPGFEPPGFPRGRSAHLEGLAGHRFWYEPRHRLLGRLLDRHAPRAEGALEIGCGVGGFLPHLASRTTRLWALDAYAEPLTTIPPRPSLFLAQGDLARLPLPDQAVDLGVALDVLEHVDPAALLGEARRVVHPRGALLLSVPAGPRLWSELDVAAGHRTRYTATSLAAELREHGWRLVEWTHFQAFLYPLLLVSRRLASLRRAERTPRRLLFGLLGTVNRLEVAVFRDRRLPFGSSLVGLARPA